MHLELVVRYLFSVSYLDIDFDLSLDHLYRKRVIIYSAWAAGYLACARCAGSGSIVAMDNGAPTSSQRCPNCAGATKVLDQPRSVI